MGVSWGGGVVVQGVTIIEHSIDTQFQSVLIELFHLPVQVGKMQKAYLVVSDLHLESDLVSGFSVERMEVVEVERMEVVEVEQMEVVEVEQMEVVEVERMEVVEVEQMKVVEVEQMKVVEVERMEVVEVERMKVVERC